jgi:hypothetical protein
MTNTAGALPMRVVCSALALILLPGCGSPSEAAGPDPPPLDLLAWAFSGSGVLKSLEFPDAGYAHLALALAASGNRCEFQGSIEVEHRDTRNRTLVASSMYFTNGTTVDSPQWIWTTNYEGDSLRRADVGLQAMGIGVSRRVEPLPALRDSPGSKTTLEFDGNFTADPVLEAFGLEKITRPVVNFLLVSEAPAETQGVKVSLTWKNCLPALKVDRVGPSISAYASDFTSDAGFLAGPSWAAQNATWSGGLANAAPLRVWSLHVPTWGSGIVPSGTGDFGGQVRADNGRTYSVPLTHLAPTPDEASWTVNIPVVASDSEAGLLVFYASSVEPAILPLPAELR